MFFLNNRTSDRFSDSGLNRVLNEYSTRSSNKISNFLYLYLFFLSRNLFTILDSKADSNTDLCVDLTNVDPNVDPNADGYNGINIFNKIKLLLQKTIKIILITLIIFFDSFNNNFLLANYPLNPAIGSNSSIDIAPNGIRILNISSPNSHGISHNLFADFNVGDSGLIINNSSATEKNITQTQLAGIIPINPNLQNGSSASLIINEVVSINPSQIDGFVEIAGKKSDLIIANPNGISINGAGFINVNNLNIVAGRPNLSPNYERLDFYFDNQDYDNNIKIFERGVNIEEVGVSNFLASNIKINAPIFAKENELNLIASQKPFSYYQNKFVDNVDILTNKELTQVEFTKDETSKEFSIDAGNLTQIQGGKIFIIATNKGLGVNYAGDILSQKNGIKIVSNGDMVINNLKAIDGDIVINSFDGNVELKENIKTFENGDIKIIANNLINNAQINSAQNLEIIAFNQFSNNDKKDFSESLMPIIWANNDLKIFSKDLINDGKIIAKNNLIAQGVNIENNGFIHGNKIVDLFYDNNLLNNQTISNGFHEDNCSVKQCLNQDLSALDKSSLIFENENFLKLASLNFLNKQRVLSDNLLIISAINLDNNLILSFLNSKNNLAINTLNFNNANGLINAENSLEITDLKSRQINDLSSGININKLNNFKNIINQQEINKNFFSNIDYYFLINNNISQQSSKSLIHNSLDQANELFNNIDKFVINFGDETIRANKLIKINLNDDQDLKISSLIKTSADIEINGRDLLIQNDIISNGSITLNSHNSLINGIIDKQNKIIAENEIKIKAENLFENYGQIDAGSSFNIAVESGNIILNKDSKINGRQNDNYLQAINGKILQNSLDLITNSDLIIKAQNLDNSGLISSYKNIIFEISDSLNNLKSSTIASKENITFNVAKNIINHANSDIYSQGNILIKGFDLDGGENLPISKVNLFENISANVIAENGYLKIYATDFKNVRETSPFNALLDPLNKGPIGVYYTNDYPENFGKYSWYFNNFGCFGHKCQEWYYGYYAKQLTNPDSTPAYIHSNNNFEFYGDDFTNRASNIYSNNNILITAKNFNNLTISDQGLYALRAVFSGSDDHTIIYSLANNTFISYNPGNGSHTGSYQDYNNFAQSFPALIKANGSIKINADKNINNSNFQQFSSTPIIASKNINLVNNLDLADLSQSTAISFDLASYLKYDYNDSFFKINNNPHKPLIETRLKFIDQNNYFASQYFYQKIGLDLNEIQKEFELKNLRFIGDQFFQNKIISDKLREINYDQLRPSDFKNNNEVIRTLIDNAISQKDLLNLTLNESLSKEQSKQVKSDMLWFEKESIQGNNYIVPKLYLSQITKKNIQNNLLSKSAIIAKDNLDLISNNSQIINQGLINGKNLNLEASEKIVNENFARIESSESMNIKVHNGSLINFSDIKAQENLAISTSQDVINSASILTNDNKLLSSGQFYGYNPYINNFSSTKSVNTKSELLQIASISAGNIEINAKGNFVNQSAKISSQKDISINSDQNIIFDNLQLVNKEYLANNFGGKRISQANSSTVNLVNNIDAKGDINFFAKGINPDNVIQGNLLENERGNILIKNSQILAGQDLNMIAKNQIDITSALNYSEKIDNYKSTSSNIIKQYFATSSSIVNSPSQIEVLGNLKILSGSNTNIIASKINVAQDGLIKTGYFTDLNPNSSTYLQEFVSNNANLNVINGKDIEQKFSKLTTRKITFSPENALLIAGMTAALVLLAPVSLSVVLGSAVAGGSVGSINTQKNSKSNYSYHEKIVKSELNFGKNLSLISANDIAILGSKISDSLQQIKSPNIKNNLSENVNFLEIKPANNLTISAVYENNISQNNVKENGNYFFKNSASGYLAGNVIDSEINLSSSNLKIAVGGKIFASFAKENLDEENLTTKIIAGENLDEENFKIKNNFTLSYLSQLDQKNIEYNFLENITNKYDKTSRGLTKSGTVVVAITASALVSSVLSGFELLSAPSVTSSSASASSSAFASASSANTSLTMTLSTSSSTSLSSAVTLSSSALGNTAIASGSVLSNTLNASIMQSTLLSVSQVGLTKVAISQALIHGLNNAFIALVAGLASSASVSAINNQARLTLIADDLTQSQSLKNLAISTLTAGISGTLSSFYQPIVVVNNSIDNLKNLFIQAGIEGSSALLAQGIIDPKNLVNNRTQQLKNSVILGLAKVGANEIGQAYHQKLSPLRDSNSQYLTNLDGTPLVTNSISRFEQLMLHGSLGCLSAILLKANCYTLGSSAILGELIGEQYQTMVKNNLVNKELASLVPEFSGAINAIVLNNFFQEDDDKLSRNINFSSTIAKNVAKENALQIMGHEVFGNNNHLTIIHVPESLEQAKYVNKKGYVYDNQAGLWMKTWGAGPDNNFLSIFTNLTDQNLTNLVSENNRQRDIDLSIKNYKSPYLVKVSDEEKFVDLLDQLDKNYRDNLAYQIFPQAESAGYNSNSYVAGLLNASKILPQDNLLITKKYQWQAWEYDNSQAIDLEYNFPYNIPGYEKPIPSNYFISNTISNNK